METRPVFTAQRDYTSRVVVPLTGKRRTPDGFQTAFESKRPAFDFPQQRPASPVSSKRKQRKPPNYLRHGDRCSIIKRVADGEPQASLAREFGVTRAAVCQMYKNRAEILSRDNEPEQLSPYPTAPPQASITQGTPTAINRSKVKGIRPSSTNRTGASVLPALTSRSKRVEGLLRRLRDERTNPVDSRRAAARLTFILLEETLASFDYQQDDDDDGAFSGATFCAIDPHGSTGQIHVKPEHAGSHRNWQLEYLDVPDNITDFDVLLFSTSANGGAECKAIENPGSLW
ncbi:uncharacterized protein PITG_15175 [Phytophthora infestans T30-4]|uniref:HTH psq-type domain-containing protein n=1 Tax=Phytophthora infestans (strain T30-4) TaxID=403677 RepID=D0NQ42_PHYIT|nr:uncharacterized protein PITG_15175 [Phytophthora infestans T30-4]EEY62774.1 conserved hypothetical protein [Phytophthora infestans T30-4]|eukprot:XP_002898649.1 conserved hypothetical protein [Phytophthora infestans T30-4]